MHTRLQYVLIAAAGIVIGALAMWGFLSSQDVTPYVVEGYSSGTNYDGTAIGISQEVGGTGASEGYYIGGVRWREFGGPWHTDGTAPSLAWPSYGQHIRIGVIDYKPTDDGYGGGQAVVWLEVIDTDYMVTE